MEAVETTGAVRHAKPSTNRYPVFTGRMPFLSHNCVGALKGNMNT